MALEKVEIALVKIAKHETNEKILGYQIRGALRQNQEWHIFLQCVLA